MDIETKKKAFEYLLTQMLKWGGELIPAVPRYSFTRLKALKLLFFAAAVKNANGQDMLDVFDNFYALPNGPVESDIYNSITADQLTHYTFRDFSFRSKEQYSDNDLSDELKARIDEAVTSLKGKNGKIVAYSAECLVALSHSWMAWQSSIQVARMLGKGSYRMDVNKIRTNTQIFTI